MRRLLVAVAMLGVVGLAGFLAVRAEQPGWWVRLWYPLDYGSVISGNAHLYHLDPALVAAVVYQESHFDPHARSAAGAVGLMQLLPDTARGIALRTGGSHFDPKTDLLDPDLNVRYGCWYLNHLRQKYSAYSNGPELALAAFNAGQGNVDAWIAATPAGRPVPIKFAETRAYVADVERLERLYRKAYGDQLG
ncbi:MAG: soluble lytic murein transglycosylase [Gaiellales bacterium]|jgi:soluble lytic murein transglycosylase|nr:soluble lytic murein transglycosylase [Gaiellales bacterium]